MKSLLDLNLIDLDAAGDEQIEMEENNHREIAIIGISGMFSDAPDVQTFWENIKNGKDCIKPFPAERAETMKKAAVLFGIYKENSQFSNGGFLDEIDQFDYGFFGLSPKEASLMDPNQRLFLQTAVKAIEDAGYGGRKLSGRNVGVFTGFSDDFGIDYKTMITMADPSLFSMAVSGNVKSIIASRISYFLDLKGPSMVIDTACSSALSAIHLACQAIRDNQCEMALAGAVKVNLLPLRGGKETGIGIESADGKTRTFDDSSDGTGIGEGVGAILLKPLSKAKSDGDTIYAVIKGSAYNQDGASMGITAPNAQAQQQVILKAWSDAGVEPETISYIEAHGTGTKLGDPIEIDGLEGAFREYTNKKQFCAIGSVKSNIGHLDNASGIAGMIKAVFALKEKKIPPTINLRLPNRKINFETSPLYISSRLSDWKSGLSPRRCGVSAFGLSGTNCHLVLEEAPADNIIRPDDQELLKLNIFTLSAKSEKSLGSLLNKYNEFCNNGLNYRIEDICYTANTGRGHYQYRLALIVSDYKDFCDKIEEICKQDFPSLLTDNVYSGRHQVVPERKKADTKGDISEKDLQQLNLDGSKNVSDFVNGGKTSKEILEIICKLYVSGADISFDSFYRNTGCRKVNLPTYQFDQSRSWLNVEIQKDSTRNAFVINEHPMNHPLFDYCIVESMDTRIYYSEFSAAKHWVLSDHKVKGNYVTPGTTYLEMIREAFSNWYHLDCFELRDIVFIKPMIVKDNEIREVHTVLRMNDNRCDVYVASRLKGDDQWIKHAEGKVVELNSMPVDDYDLLSIRQRCTLYKEASHKYLSKGMIDTGERWNNIKEIFTGDQELLAYLELDPKYADELAGYGLHPALLDCGANIEIRSISERLYLPFFYKSFKIYGKMPGKIISYIRRKTDNSKNKESVTFDLSIMDQNGKSVIEVEGYIIKEMKDTGLLSGRDQKPDYYHMVWKSGNAITFSLPIRDGLIMVIKDQRDVGNKLIKQLSNSNYRVIEVEISSRYKKISDEKYLICGCEQDYLRILQDHHEHLSYIIHLQSITFTEPENSYKSFIKNQNNGVDSLFYLMKAISTVKSAKELSILLVSDYGNLVTNHEHYIRPESAMLFGLGKTINGEFKNVNCKALDVDQSITAEDIIQELTAEGVYLTAYRDHHRYVEYFEEIEIENIPEQEINLLKDGAYLITGGTGGLGAEIAQLLATKENINLCLISRSGFPDQSEWDQLLAAGENEKLNHKIRIFKEIEKSGSTLSFFSVDISKFEEAKKMIETVRKKFGKINGLIHCAGVAGNGFIRGKNKAVFDEVLLPKVHGTWILDQLTQGEKIDFFIMFSSVSSILGAAGQSDYTAANAFLDAFTYQRKLQGKTSLTINWPAWGDVGMAVDYNVVDTSPFKAISSKCGVAVFDEIMNKDTPQLIVSEISDQSAALLDEENTPFILSEKVKSKIRQKTRRKLSISGDQTKSEHTVLVGRSETKPYSRTEQIIANIWGKLLELEQIDINRSFFELGGNSLFAIKMEIEMEKYNISIEYADIEEYSSIRELAAFIDGVPGNSLTADKVLAESDYVLQIKNSEVVLLEGMEPFHEFVFKGCFYSALFPIIKYYNKSILEFTVNNVIIYDTQIVNQTEYFTARLIETKSFKQLTNEIGIQINTKTISNDIVKDLKTSLAGGNPVIISIDCFYESIRNDTFNKFHWPHNLLVYGYDDNNKTFHILEHKNRGSAMYEKCVISYTDVINSYHGFCLNYKNLDIINSDFNYLKFDSSQEYPTYYEVFKENDAPDQGEPIDNIRAVFISNYLQQKQLIFVGLDKLKGFQEIMVSIILDQNLQIEKAEGILAVLNTIVNGKQIEEYQIRNLFLNHTELAGLSTAIINKWEIVRSIIAKYLYSGKYKLNDMQSLITAANQAYELEVKFYKNLFLVIKNLNKKECT